MLRPKGLPDARSTIRLFLSRSLALPLFLSSFSHLERWNLCLCFVCWFFNSNLLWLLEIWIRLKDIRQEHAIYRARTLSYRILSYDSRYGWQYATNYTIINVYIFHLLHSIIGISKWLMWIWMAHMHAIHIVNMDSNGRTTSWMEIARHIILSCLFISFHLHSHTA